MGVCTQSWAISGKVCVCVCGVSSCVFGGRRGSIELDFLNPLLLGLAPGGIMSTH